MMCRMRMMRVAGVPRFSTADFYSPTWPMTREALSALINFAKFREDRILVYNQLMVEMTENTKRCTTLRSNQQIGEENVRVLTAERAAEEPEKRDLEKRVSELTQQV